MEDVATDARAWSALAAATRADLDAWAPPDAAQDVVRREFVALLDRAGADAVRRDGGAEHLTVSAFVLSPDLTQVLLCHHRKGGFWVQLGGHLEAGDASPTASAVRETREESGLTDVVLAVPHPVDVHRHALGAAFGRCRAHWDVGHALLADPAVPLAVSDESEDVAWFAVDRLPEGAVRDLPGRLALVRAAVAGARAAG